MRGAHRVPRTEHCAGFGHRVSRIWRGVKKRKRKRINPFLMAISFLWPSYIIPPGLNPRFPAPVLLDTFHTYILRNLRSSL